MAGQRDGRQCDPISLPAIRQSFSRLRGLAAERSSGLILDLVKANRTVPATTESVDDYLKAILELSGPEERQVTSNALAGHLDIRAASVTGMLQKLASQRPSFVKDEKQHGVVR